MSLYPQFSFKKHSFDKHSKAHLGELKTPHGSIQTPNFIFCATKAALKSVTTQQAKEAGADIILSNTYHLMLQPGADIVAAHGGLHKMLNWDGPMLTDSGGFQIFSLGHGGVANEIKGRGRPVTEKKMLKINETGALFRSYIDGSMHLLTPEISMEVQRKLGPDFVVVLDECTPYHSSREYMAASMERSHRWAIRSLRAFERHNDGKQALYGIVQGGTYRDLRKISSEFIASQPFFAQAIGGTLGGTKEEMHEIVGMICENLHKDRPTHLLGIGGISDIWNGVEHGIDTFDCVHPTRIARHGCALVNPVEHEGKEHINLFNACYRDDMNPIDATVDCYTNRHFTRAYIHHLLKADELLAGQLLTIHNIAFMTKLARAIRSSIAEGRFSEERKRWVYDR